MAPRNKKLLNDKDNLFLEVCQGNFTLNAYLIFKGQCVLTRQI